VHVGGAGLTLPRYITATRPGSRQLVFEPDEEVLGLVRDHLPWRRKDGIRLRAEGGRAGLQATPDERFDVVVVDAFTGGVVPAELTTYECLRDAARVLASDGTYLLNIADGAPLAYLRRIASTALGVFADVLLLGEPSVLRGRRYGNLVVVGSAGRLPIGEVRRRIAGATFPARVVDREGVRRLAGGAAVSTDADPALSPRPPGQLWGEFAP
jgi:spermidine synthase